MATVVGRRVRPTTPLRVSVVEAAQIFTTRCGGAIRRLDELAPNI